MDYSRKYSRLYKDKNEISIFRLREVGSYQYQLYSVYKWRGTQVVEKYGARKGE